MRSLLEHPGGRFGRGRVLRRGVRVQRDPVGGLLRGLGHLAEERPALLPAVLHRVEHGVCDSDPVRVTALLQREDGLGVETHGEAGEDTKINFPRCKCIMER